MKTYGGNCQEYGCSVQSTSDGGYIVAGYSWSFGAGNPFHTNVYLIKTDAKGDTLWTKIYGDTANDRGYSVQLTSDGGYIIAGFTESFGSGKSDVWLLKTDSNGDTLWTKTYGGEDEDLGYFVQQVSDGGYIIAGYRDDDLYLIKTDPNGDTMWTKTYGGSGCDEARAVYQTPDNGFIVAGWTNSFGAGGDDIWLIKTDANGDTLWAKTYGGPDDETGNSLHPTSDGGYIITGTTSKPLDYDCYVYIVKTNENGELLWTKTFGEVYFQTSYSVDNTLDGGYIIAGWKENIDTGRSVILLIKIGSSRFRVGKNSVLGTITSC
jgi:hypothetical protein